MNPCSPNNAVRSFQEGVKTPLRKAKGESSPLKQLATPLRGDYITEDLITKSSGSEIDSTDAMQAQLLMLQTEDPRKSPPSLASSPRLMFPLNTSNSKDETFGRNHFGNQVHMISPLIIPVTELRGHSRQSTVY